MKIDRREVGFVLLRSLLQYISFLFVSVATSSVFVLVATGFVRELHIPIANVYAISSFALVLPFYSVVRSFELYDLRSRSVFLKTSGEVYSLRSDIAVSFGERSLRLKLICDVSATVFLAFVLPYELGYAYLMAVFRDTFALGEGTLYLLKGAIVCPTMVVLSFLAKTSAHKWWIVARTGEREKMDKLTRPNLRLFLELLKIFAIYAVSSVALPTVIMLFVSLVFTLGLLGEQPWIIPLALVIVTVPFVVRNILTLGRRRKFYRAFVRSAAERGWCVSGVNNPIRSSVVYRPGASFTISKGDKCYAVRLASIKQRGRPVYISPDGYYTEKRTVSFLKITLFHIMTDTEYTFESDAKKLVVFSPMPKRLYINYGRTDTAPDDGDGGTLPTAVVLRAAVTGGGSRGRSIHGPGYVSDVDRGIIKPFETGECVGDYKFFTPSGFISAMENDCLDR
ncbi:MAG: hypothetical protein IJW48_01920 [Clostridia bacterium]|nr:hypothetical protein [Clostridia bacterium]